jgi:hypothetical protein
MGSDLLNIAQKIDDQLIICVLSLLKRQHQPVGIAFQRITPASVLGYTPWQATHAKHALWLALLPYLECRF